MKIFSGQKLGDSIELSNDATAKLRRFVITPPKIAKTRKSHIPVRIEELISRERFNVPFNRDLFFKSLNWTRLIITNRKCLPSGRIGPAQGDNNSLKNKISVTPCFMFLHLQIWARGVLNHPGVHCGNNFDLSTIDGFALYMHELYHIYQFRKSPMRLLLNYLKAIHDSLVIDRVFYSHRLIEFEIEAIAFELWVREYLLNKGSEKTLEILKSYR